MIICALDLETTGLDPEKDQVTEVGAVLWDTEINQPIKFFNKLLKIKGSVPELIVKLTGITDELLDMYGESPDDVWADFINFKNEAEMFMAHNAPFDRAFTENQIGEDSFRLWIDSSVDVDYPESITTRKLTHLAAEHGFVNPFAHRAMTDVLTMCQVVSQYDWETTIKNAKTPNVAMRAMVTYDQNQKAKGAGYRWDSTRKFWIKNVKEHRVNEEINKCLQLGFTSKRLG
jgi:DNA polymerase-3 subunit epsilon